MLWSHLSASDVKIPVFILLWELCAPMAQDSLHCWKGHQKYQPLLQQAAAECQLSALLTHLVLLLPSTSIIAPLTQSPTTCGFCQPCRPKSSDDFIIFRPTWEEGLGNLKSRDRWALLHNLLLLGCPSGLYPPGGDCCFVPFSNKKRVLGSGMRQPWEGGTWSAEPNCQFQLVEHYCL